MRVPLASTVDRYLAIRFLTSTAIVFATCCALVILVDFVELLRRTGDRENATVLRVLTLAAFRMPTFTEMLFPFAVLFGTMAALLRLSQKLELVVIRAAGLSVWQFMLPAVAIALLVGSFGTFVYNPLAAFTRERAERIETMFFGPSTAAGVQSSTGGRWLRQEGIDGQYILNAGGTLEQGTELSAVVIHAFDRQGGLLERVDATRAVLREGHWELSDAVVIRMGEEPENFGTYLVATNLSRDQVRESLASVETISFYDLPTYIELAEAAGLPANRLRLQYQLLMARPWLLTAMALIAATVSLRLFRLGNILPMIMGGVGAGFLLYVAIEISRQLGQAGIVSELWAAWTPVVVAMLTGLTILLYQEDG